MIKDTEDFLREVLVTSVSADEVIARLRQTIGQINLKILVLVFDEATGVREVKVDFTDPITGVDMAAEVKITTLATIKVAGVQYLTDARPLDPLQEFFRRLSR